MAHIIGEKQTKGAQKRKNKKVNKAYDALKNEVAVVFQKQYLVDDEGNTYMREVPVAIGRRVTEDPTGQLTPPEQIKKQSKGVAVHIEHYFLDELWNVGSQKINVSDECKQVMIKRADGTVPIQAEEEAKEEVKQEVPSSDTELVDSSEVPPENSEKIGSTEKATEEDKAENSKQSSKIKEEAEEDKEPKGPTLTPAEMDDLIKRNFILCVVRHIKDSDFPLEPSLLQGEYMYRYEHKDLGKIDFKKSNYIKVTKFLRKMKQTKLISFDKMKGVDHELILGVNRKGMFENYITFTAMEKEKVDISGFKKIEQSEETKQKEPEEVKGAPMKEYPLVEIEEIFKINSKELVAVFEDVKAPQTTYYSVDDCREVISKYITKNELEHSNKKNNAFLDANLVKLIKNESDIQKDYKTGKPITNKGCLFKDIELFLRPFHVIRKLGVVAKDAEKIKPGYIPKVKIVIEKFMNKNITRVIGLETWEIDFKDACHVFQVKLAVGVSICESEKSFSSEHIKIQGIHPDRVEHILIEEFKIARKHIDQINTLKGKKNKAKKK